MVTKNNYAINRICYIIPVICVTISIFTLVHVLFGGIIRQNIVSVSGANLTANQSIELVYSVPQFPTLIITPKTIPTITVAPTVLKRSWVNAWSNGENRILKNGSQDPFDSEFVARGNGEVHVNGEGVATLRGDSPRMYVYDSSGVKKWNNVEVTIYGKRIAEKGTRSSQGFVLGARSEHQSVTEDNPCSATTYYGRVLYDGRAVFQKELIHGQVYSSNQPSEQNIINWQTEDGTIPYDVWIGVKYIVQTLSKTSVKLSLFIDRPNDDLVTWEKAAEYIDSGEWTDMDSDIDVHAVCGFPKNKVLFGPNTSVFIRNDLVEEVQYKNFSIREL